MYLDAPQPFRLECDWLNAQAFRWTERDGWFYGIVGGHLIRVRNIDDGIEYEGGISTEEGDATLGAVRLYFRLDQEDIDDVHDALREADPVHMPRLIKNHGYIRVLRQDPWECLVAYICSANASVDSIRVKLNKLADAYGDTLTFDGMTCRSIPAAEQLAGASVKELRDLGLGLSRIAGTLHEVATAVVAGNLDLGELAGLPHTKARERLKNYPGIGPKIADCVALFALGKDDAFPVDTNIGAALDEYYGKKYTPGAENVGLLEWARRTFGDHAGYAGQLLFLDQRSPLR